MNISRRLADVAIEGFEDWPDDLVAGDAAAAVRRLRAEAEATNDVELMIAHWLDRLSCIVADVRADRANVINLDDWARKRGRR